MEYKEIRLQNGAKLYLMKMPRVKTVALGVYVNAGTREEIWPKQAGIAHATEHMVFQGTEEFPNSKAMTEHIESVGGAINAFTWQEMTVYFNMLPAEEMEKGFKVLSQQLRKPLFEPEKIKTEMKNIIQEIHRSNDDPTHFLGNKFEEIMYGTHPLGKLTLGTEESVLAFSKESFREFFEKFYHPANFTFLAIGNLKICDAKTLLEKYFPEKNQMPPNARETLPVLREPENAILTKDIEQAHTMIGAIAPAGRKRESSILKVFLTMIGGGMSFPLFQEVRDKRGLCYAINTGYDSWSDAGTLYVYVGTDPKKVEEAKSVIIEVIQASKSSTKLLEKAKSLTKGRLAFAFESPGQILRSAAYGIAFRGKPKSYQELLDEINSFTIEEVEQTVNKYLAPEKLVTVSLVPKS